jgi:CBS-domain-containing membrane protein
MYRFLEGTADQYMTRAVTTVTRQTTMRELEALFEKHDFNSFPVVEYGKMLGIVTKFDFLRAFAFTDAPLRRVDATARCRNDDRSCRSCRTVSATNASSSVDGEPEEPQLSSYGA